MKIEAIADALGVNQFTVYRYFKQGMPHTRTADGGYDIDVNDCLKWIDDQFPVRPRAKKKDTAPEPREEGIRGIANRSDPDEIMALATGEEDVTPAQARVLRDITAAANSAHVLNLRRRMVVPVEDAKRAVTAVLSATRAGLTQLPGRTARIITAKLQLPIEKEALVREYLEKEIERICNELAADPLENLAAPKDIARRQ